MTGQPQTTPTDTIELPSELGVAQAPALQAELLKLIDNDADIGINGGEVQRVHAASLQVLAAWTMERQQGERHWQWTRLSPALREAAEHLGLTGLLQIPAEQDDTET